MSSPDLEFAHAAGLGLVLGASLGLRAFLALFTISGVAYTGQLKRCENLAWMGSPATLLALLMGAFGEILADKIPAVDHPMYSSGTLARPVAWGLAAASLMAKADSLLICVIWVAAGGTLVGVSHLGKAMGRDGESCHQPWGHQPDHFFEDVMAWARGTRVAVAAVGMAAVAMA
jgi:hypothetical protein